jgi:hypothetical protein
VCRREKCSNAEETQHEGSDGSYRIENRLLYCEIPNQIVSVTRWRMMKLDGRWTIAGLFKHVIVLLLGTG